MHFLIAFLYLCLIGFYFNFFFRFALFPFLPFKQLSLCKNSLLRMYGVCRLHFLQELTLTDNGILTIEGLKELTQLKYLNLQGNSIKTIEHLNSNYQLEYLNLSGNSVGSIADISFLKNLRVNIYEHFCILYTQNTVELFCVYKFIFHCVMID